MRVWAAACIVTCVILSCDSDSLTRKGVPVWVGISASDGLPKMERKRDLGKLKQLGFQRVMLLVPLSKDGNGWPRLLPSVHQNLQQLIADVAADSFRLGVQLYAEHPDSVFAAARIDTDAWLTAYQKLIFSVVLPACKAQKLEWLVLGRQFTALEADIQGWKGMCGTLRMHTRAKLVYGTTGDRIAMLGFWQSLDAIGIVHEPSPSGDYKAQARREHTFISQIAQQYNKPIFVVSTKLLGADKELKFKNALRFYNTSVAVQGICLNTLFANSVFTDSISAFGVQLEPETVKYLWQYNAEH